VEHRPHRDHCIRLCLMLQPPSSSNCTWILLSTFLSRDLFSKYSLVVFFLCGLVTMTFDDAVIISSVGQSEKQTSKICDRPETYLLQRKNHREEDPAVWTHMQDGGQPEIKNTDVRNWCWSHAFVVTSYRAMHYNAKRGLAIACRLSVCLSVTLVDIGWKSWKLIARTNSPIFLLLEAQRCHPPTAREHGERWGRSGVLEHKSGNISKTRKERRKVTMEGL